MEVERYLKRKCEDMTSDADRDIAGFTSPDSGPTALKPALVNRKELGLGSFCKADLSGRMAHEKKITA